MKLQITNSPGSGYFGRKPRVSVYPSGETIMENLAFRRDRPLAIYRQALVQGLTELGVDMSRIKYRWSQKAGCSCGCSPAFIIDGYDSKLAGRDTWIAIEAI